MRHVIRVIRAHDLTNKKIMTKAMTMTMTKTFRENLPESLWYLRH